MTPLNQPQQQQPGAQAADEALDNTNRPLPSDEANDGRGGLDQPDGDREDLSLRDLKPRSTERQFGSSPDIAPAADAEQGAKDWVEHSPGVKENFPDRKSGA